MPGPSAQSIGSEGIVSIAGLRAGDLTTWRLVLSPTAIRKDADGNALLTDDGRTLPAYTLFGEGHLLRFFLGAVGSRVRAHVVPTQPPTRIGRPKPPKLRPFTVAGILFSLTPTHIVISEGDIEPAHG
jgi:hypothetical protein